MNIPLGRHISHGLHTLSQIWFGPTKCISRYLRVQTVILRNKYSARYWLPKKSLASISQISNQLEITSKELKMIITYLLLIRIYVPSLMQYFKHECKVYEVTIYKNIGPQWLQEEDNTSEKHSEGGLCEIWKKIRTFLMLPDGSP